MLITTANPWPRGPGSTRRSPSLTVRPRNADAHSGAGFKSLVGVRLKGRTRALGESRERVNDGMRREAEALGGSPTLALFDTSRPERAWTEICGFGTPRRVRLQ